jgi:UDPglucose--hexose-1-phosphate uridylyltransferase
MSGIAKRVSALADGRELIYFDDADTTLPPDRAPDPRLLELRPPTPEMRLDPLTGEWIAVAAARQNRVVMPPAGLDPLAPQAPGNPSEIPSDYDVAVFENRSPAFGPGLPVPGSAEADPSYLDGPGIDGAGIDGTGLGRVVPAYGRCEVICFSSASDGAFGSVSRSRARTVIEAWADRTVALSSMPGIRQVYIFENRGAEIGVTLQHPHGQIYGYPFVTPRTRQLLAQLDAYGPALFADILRFEQKGPRVLLAGDHWTAFVPFAARWPLEAHMVPHEHVADFAATSEAQRDELAVLYLRLLRGVDALYPDPTPYIAAWHQAPVRSHRDTARLHLRLMSPRRAADKLKHQAGSESGMGAWIGDIPAEVQAEELRAAIARADTDNPV